MKSVLVTGGSGLLGAALVRHLLEQGKHRLVVLDLVDFPDRLSEVLEQIEYIQGDAADPEILQTVVKTTQPEIIYHFAALLGASCEENPVEAMRVNADGTFHLLELARRHAVTQVIYASSVSTFALELPEKTIRDHYLQRPISFYGVIKLFGEGAGGFYRRKFGLDFRAIRYPAILGPGSRSGGFISYTSAMIEASLKGDPYTVQVHPDTRIPLVHTRDAARAAVTLAQAPVTDIKGVNYLIDGVRPTPSAGEMAQLLKDRIPGTDIEFQPIQEWQELLELNAVPIDDKPARQEWGWRAEYDSYEKIVETFLD